MPFWSSVPVLVGAVVVSLYLNGACSLVNLLEYQFLHYLDFVSPHTMAEGFIGVHFDTLFQNSNSGFGTTFLSVRFIHWGKRGAKQIHDY